MLAWKVAPAIAMGNTVVLKPAEYTSLTALLFAQICQEAGLPKGVVNIVTGDGRVGDAICSHEDVDKIAFTGSTEVGRIIRRATAGSGKALTLELGGKSPYIVFDDADLDSAVEGLVDAIWFNQGQVCCAGSRLLVQEGVADRFHTKLRTRMEGLRVGNPLDKVIDVGALVDPVQLQTVTTLVDSVAGEGDVFRAPCALPENGCFYPPTLITGLSQASTLMQEEIFGPVLVSTTFRTPSEAVQVANNTRYGLAASVWSENVNLALDIAPKLVAGVVWVNGTNMFDAAAGFGGVRESGFGREGGWEGLQAYTKPRTKPVPPLKPVAPPVAAPPKDAKSMRWTAPPSSLSAASRRGPMAAIRKPSGPPPRAHCWATWHRQPQGHPQRGRGGARGQVLVRHHRPFARADPLLHRREPLGPRRGICPPHQPDDRQAKRRARGRGRRFPPVQLRCLGGQVRRGGRETRAPPARRGPGDERTGGRDRCLLPG